MNLTMFNFKVFKSCIFCFLFIFCFLSKSIAQELSCEVIVNDDRVQTQERQVFRDLEESISNFMNNREWTNDTFKEEERIKCNIYITLKKSSTNSFFEATVQIQSQRPVYGTDFNTQLINFVDDKWRFEYSISQPIIYSENSYTNELTALLSFYAYMIIGIDYDTFSPNGGSPYFDRAFNIMSNAQQAGGAGWNTFGDTRDRYWLIANMNDIKFEPFRKALYTYHLQGMDVMNENYDKGKLKVFESLKEIKKVKDNVPVSVTLDAFFNSKSDELVNLFSEGETEIRQQVIDLLVKLDPSNSSKYKKIIK